MNAATVAETVDRVLFERYGDIQLFANDGVIRDGSSEERTARLQHYHQLYWYYSWLGITDADGTVIAAPTCVLRQPPLSTVQPLMPFGGQAPFTWNRWSPSAMPHSRKRWDSWHRSTVRGVNFVEWWPAASPSTIFARFSNRKADYGTAKPL